MISFRYHIVTIIAVFLALAIGLLGGAAFVQPALQEQLQEQTDRLRNDLDDRTQQIPIAALTVPGLDRDRKRSPVAANRSRRDLE